MMTKPVVLLLSVPMLLLSLLIISSARDRNYAVVTAHKRIYQVRQTGQLPEEKAANSISHIQEAVRRDPDNPFLYGDLASLLAWTGHYQASIDAQRSRLALYIQDPLSRYAPFIRWHHQLTGQPSQDRVTDTLLIYRHWLSRYPHRAETYSLLALLFIDHLGELDRAAATLRRGLDAGAQPPGLLEFQLDTADQKGNLCPNYG